ncbi:MAG TPA: hypothetical protein VKY15_01385, partial [Acidimicrobiales bacterium]|nr:hypothetical protein [Acidimicrobiales bacterium]
TYLAAVVCSDPRVKSVSVDCRKVVIRPKSWWRMSTTVHLPEPIAEFVVAFDALCFPSLVWHPPALEAKDPVG